MKTSTGQGINPGAMRSQLRIQQRTSTQDGAGEQLPNWTTIATVRAEVMRLPGKEVVASDTRNGRVPTFWKLRFLAGVEPKMRVVDEEDRVYNILSATDPTRRREELLISAEELVGRAP